MKKILILIPYYEPGYRSGGPQRTIENVIKAFGNKCKIHILTQNHDLGSTTEYDCVEINKWLDRRTYNIKYIKRYNLKKIKENAQDFDLVYSCGLFEINSIYAILLEAFKLIPKLYIAPMGVFSENALNSKGVKKKCFLWLFKTLGFFKHVIWSFTSESEKDDAIAAIKKKHIKEYVLAEDLPQRNDSECKHLRTKKEGELNVVFLSRISPKKNLDYALNILKKCSVGKIYFDLYGVIENELYWNQCQKLIAELPSNVYYRYCGEVIPSNVNDVFSRYDVFLFPTKGENYGHVIYEALASGCVPIISDLTPWTKSLVENKCGMSISLDEIELFVKTINKFVKMDDYSIKEYSQNAISFAKKKYKQSLANSGYNKIFL